MNYINDNTQEIKRYNQLRNENPHVSLPVDGTEIMMDEWHAIHKTAPPAIDNYTQFITKGDPLKVGGVYEQVWVINAKSQVDIDAQVEIALKTKLNECDRYAENLIFLAKSNPIDGVNVDPISYGKRLKSREKDNANKLSGEISLTQEEKDKAKTDQKLSEYEVKCWDASDKAIKEVEKGTDTATIMAMDVSTLAIWPLWSPPV